MKPHFMDKTQFMEDAQWLEKLRLSKRTIVVIVVLISVVMIMTSVTTRVNETARLSAQRDQIQTQVAMLKQTEVALKTEIYWSASDQAVDEWAREDQRMLKPGDIAVIPMPVAGFTPKPSFQPTATPRPAENWEIWWELFLGQ